MKQGRTLSELVRELERQQDSRQDFLADTRKLIMTGDKYPKLVLEDHDSFKMTEHCHSQIAGRLKIPKRYYDRMRDVSPELFAQNVNHWFKQEPEMRMIRTLDGDARAFLSNHYRALDNYDLMSAALPTLQEAANNETGMEIKSCEVTSLRLYLKVVFPRVQGEVKKGDPVQAGIVISNSEVGAGAVKVEPLVYRLVCTNGMIAGSTLRKYHVGRGNGELGDDIREILSDHTRQLDDAAMWAKVRDVVRASFDRAIFEENLIKLKRATGQMIEASPVKAVEAVKKQFRFTDPQGDAIMRHLIEGGDLSRWGLANAVTRTASDEIDYESATELERAGGRIIDLPKSQWREIANAA